MDKLNVTSAQYVADLDGNNDYITAVIDGETYGVPIDTDNRHYVAIKEKHDDPADSFTIQDAS